MDCRIFRLWNASKRNAKPSNKRSKNKKRNDTRTKNSRIFYGLKNYFALKAVTKRNISSIIKEITNLPGLQKNEIKELNEFCKVYAIRRILKNCTLMIDYSEIKIPGMRKTKKK